MKAEMSTASYSSDAERWDAVQRRDKDADGVFYYSVRTTGVYCRPSCGARPALRANVDGLKIGPTADSTYMFVVSKR